MNSNIKASFLRNQSGFAWAAGLMLVAALFVAGLLAQKTFAQEEPTEPETPVESAPVVEPENGSDDQGDLEDSEEGDSEEGDSEEGDESDDSSDDEGEVEGSTFSALRGGHNDDDEEENHKIQICHATGNGSYNLLNIDKNGVNGHNHHGNDIIPPFEKEGPDYPGKNWTTEGQAIWNNGCKPVPETGSITIVKQVVGAGDQEVPAEWSFDFSGDLGDFSLTNEKNSNSNGKLKPGHFTVTEGNLGDNWTLTDINCDSDDVTKDGNSVDINLGEDDDVTCTFTNTYRKPEVPPTTTTIYAQKIICDEESDLPNWGAGGSDITSTTASDWLAAHPESGCHLAPWDFEWSYRNIAGDPDDNTPGFLGGYWYPFTAGEAVVDVANDGQLGIREVFNDNYIPFTGQNTDQNVSAEMYCGDDVLHYDNWEWINATAGQPIYCVAWNVPLEKEEACRVQVVSKAGDEGVGNGNAVAAWIHTGWTHALESVATWIWDSYEVVDASQTEAKTFTKSFYVDGPVNDATLELAADNRYWITINGNDVASDTGEFNYGAVTGPIDVKVTGDIQSGWNTITMKVENIGLEGYEQRPHDNPAAGIYKLVINAEEEELCEEPPVDTTADVTICKYQNSVSEQTGLADWNVWLDENNVIVSKDTIVVDDSHEYADETSENGCVTFKDVPFGDYIIGEDMPDGWQNVVDAEGAVPAGSVVDVNDTTETFNLVNTLSCNPEVNLLANGGFENPALASNSWSIFYTAEPFLEWLTGDEGIEIQNNVAGSPFAGAQFAELDPNHPTNIWQSIPTTPGNTYRLETQYSPRPGRDLEDNRFEFRKDGVALGASIARSGSANSNTDWTYESRTFVADANTTDVGFAEIGTDTSYGAYLDNAGLYCIPEVTSDDDGSITIDKVVAGEGANADLAFDFDLSWLDQDVDASISGNGEPETFSDLPEGPYTITELTSTDDDWYVTDVTCDTENYSHDAGEGDVEIVLGENEHVTCTFTNTYRPAGDGDNHENIIVRKEVTEGSNTDTFFTFNSNWDENFSLKADQEHDSGDLDEGESYSVSEDATNGWTLQGVVCSSSFDQQPEIMKDVPETIDPQNIVLSDGETVTCVFTNDQNDETPNDDTPDEPNNARSSHRRGGSNHGEVLGASTDGFCPFLKDYLHINMQNDPVEVNKAKAFFNSYLGKSLVLDGIFDKDLFAATVEFQSMFHDDVLKTWVDQFSFLDDRATGYIYQTTKWKINSILCPGYEAFPDQLVVANGTTVAY